MDETQITKEQEKNVDSLVRQAMEKTNPYSYAGVSYKRLQMYNEYKEEGLELTVEDINLTQIYAGLSVVCKQIYEDEFSKQPDIFQEMINEAIQWDKSKYPITAFPYDKEKFPYPNELETINNIIEQREKQSSSDLKFLDDHEIRHEWTVKVGKKLLMILTQKLEQLPDAIFGENRKQTFKDFVCGNDGIYDELNDGGDEADLMKSLSTYLLPAVGLVSANAAPFVVLVSVILVKSYLKSYCKA